LEFSQKEKPVALVIISTIEFGLSVFFNNKKRQNIALLCRILLSAYRPFFKNKIPVASVKLIATIEFGLSVFWKQDIIVLKFISTDLRKGPLRTAREHTNAAKDY